MVLPTKKILKEEIASVYQFLADSPPPELTSFEMELFRKLIFTENRNELGEMT